HHEPTKSVADQHIGEKPHGEPEHVPTKYVENELLKRPHAEQPSECIPQEEEEQQHRPEELAANQNIAEKPYGELELEPVATESAKQTSAEEVAADVVQDEPKELQRTSQELIAHQRVAERSNGELESITAEQHVVREAYPEPEPVLAEYVEHEPVEQLSVEQPSEPIIKDKPKREQQRPVELSADRQSVEEPCGKPDESNLQRKEEKEQPVKSTADLGQRSPEQPSEPIMQDEPKEEKQVPMELSAGQQFAEWPHGKSEYVPAENLEQLVGRPEDVTEHISEKSHEKALPQAAVIEASKEIVEEVIPPPTALQTCTCEGPDNKQHTHKTTEVITTGDVPSGGQ
uniref:Uncharacterized protein n=1 Tax=Parascaris equorum TaxID=6256 RepID=A0A914RSR1_PAREQ